MILFLLLFLLQDKARARVPLHEFNFRSDFLKAEHIISSEQGTQKTGSLAPKMSGLTLPTTPKKKKNPSFRAKLTQFDQKQTRAYLCYNML